MNPQQLYKEGKLDAAIEAAGAQLREDPANTRLRTFFFELLCFAGDYDRAEKHLKILAEGGQEKEVGALLYYGAMHAERTRADMFKSGALPLAGGSAVSPAGTLNGVAFEEIEDADPRIGPKLELFAAGEYMWLPFQHIRSIHMEPPKKLRDLLWVPAKIRTGPECKDFELGEVLLPVLAPQTTTYPDDQVRLGRLTVWGEVNGASVPFGQKLLLVDGEEVPLLEIRTLTIGPPEDGETDDLA
jgi:type VI secretion system protein ImpE